VFRREKGFRKRVKQLATPGKVITSVKSQEKNSGAFSKVGRALPVRPQKKKKRQESYGVTGMQCRTKGGKTNPFREMDKKALNT